SFHPLPRSASMLLRFTVSVRSRQSASDVHCSEPVYVVMYSNVYIHTCASLYTYIYICPSHFIYCPSPMHVYISLHVSLPCSFTHNIYIFVPRSLSISDVLIRQCYIESSTVQRCAKFKRMRPRVTVTYDHDSNMMSYPAQS